MKLPLIPILFLLLFAGCKKDPGEGGQASIRGRVMREVRIVLSNPGTLQYTVPSADQDVFIVYGDHVSPDDRVWTNFNGEFEFRNLRKGDYTVYVYSKDTTGMPGVDPDRMVIRKDVGISDRKESVNMGDIVVYDEP